MLPILSDKCFKCHGPDPKTREAGVRLDTREGALKDLGGYASVVPGDRKDSELWLRLISDDRTEVMPPPKSKMTLTKGQIQTLGRWIDAGAPWSKHWSFEPLVKPKPPTHRAGSTPAGRQANAIDAFVLTKLQSKGLKPSREASRERLFRRVTLDLTGLPPTLAELDAFLADTSPNAYEKVVDRLLASPRYGQRMAWPWLDAARYADSNGYQGDRERTMYPWRDWVVDAFNRNMPYDQFTVWQIAGDLLPNATLEQQLATGFLRNHMINGEGGRIAEENRIEYIFDQVETVGTVWLGMTFNCCRCHDHKYDPLSQRDYYSMFAFFNQTPINGGGGDPQMKPAIAITTDAQKARLAQLDVERNTLLKQLATREKELVAKQSAWEQTIDTGSLSPWTVFEPKHAKAQKQTLRVLPDASILAGGENPANDTYNLFGPVAQDGPGAIAAIRIEALRHPSMTKNGLARSNSGNFVLTEFEAIHQSKSGEKTPLKFKAGRATYEQGGFKITGVYDRKKSTGWAVHQGRFVDREHEAILVLDKPLEVKPGDSLGFVLRHDSPHASHNLGRFRLSTSSQPDVKLGAKNGDLAAAIRTPEDKRSKKQRDLIRLAHRDSDAAHRKLRARISGLNAQTANVRKQMPRVMVMQDMEPKRWRKTYILNKGLYSQRLGEVTAATPGELPAMSPVAKDAPVNRLALARWLVAKENPLTARVTVNRFWQQFFGIGLVKTVEDFGTQGERPVNQPLLDWLAADFVEHGWDVKRLVKQIVMSATYRQTARVTPDLLEADPTNRLLARGARYRMPSWMLRDQALAVSGLLVEKRGGPPVFPYQPEGVWAEATFGKKRYKQGSGDDLYRRSMYTFWRRIVGPTMFFDEAKRQTCEVKKSRTNTPLHALLVMNEPTYVEASRAFAQRVLQQSKRDVEKQAGDTSDMDKRRAELAFRMLLARTPNSNELSVLRSMLARLRKQYAADPASAEAHLTVGQSKRDASLDAVEHAVWANICWALLNTDEAVTRE